MMHTMGEAASVAGSGQSGGRRTAWPAAGGRPDSVARSGASVGRGDEGRGSRAARGEQRRFRDLPPTCHASGSGF